MELLEHCPDVLTISEAAEVLKISASVMQELIRSGKVKYVDIEGNARIFKPFLLEYIENCRRACYSSSGVDASHQAPEHLDNRTQPDFSPSSEGEYTDMAKRIKINQSVKVGNDRRWFKTDSVQEFVDKLLAMKDSSPKSEKHFFGDYAWNWFKTYSKPTIATVTATTYERQIRLYLIPTFEGVAIEDITPDDVQRLFNGLTGTKATKDKVRMVLNQILDAAVEDDIIAKNPLKSKRIKITGKASEATPPYSVEQMRFLVQHIGDIQNPVDRAYLAIQALHPLRLEEVLGLKAADIDPENGAIHICRAVTHPTRNQPEIKDTKTQSSARTIGLSALAVPYLPTVKDGEFVFGGAKPLTYTQVRRMCDRIKRDTGFSENITPIRFRTTVLTDLYDQTKDIKLTQSAAGHTTSAMTLKHYVKGRLTSSEGTAAVDRLYAG